MTFKPSVSVADGDDSLCTCVYMCMCACACMVVQGLTCVLDQGRLITAAWSLLFQRRNGEDIPVAQTKNINHRRFAASFHLKEVSSQDQDLYRCVTQSERGSGVSNFAGLIVRGEI